MKLANYILLIIFLSFSLDTFAQTSPEPKYEENSLISIYMTFPDTSNATFFERNPEVDHIVLLYKDRKPQFLFVSYDSLTAPKPKMDRYDMLFDGDAFLLNYKHGAINFLVPTINGHYQGVGMRPFHRDHLFTTIKRDSIIYILWPKEEIEADVIAIGIPPGYAGDLADFEVAVGKSLAVEKNTNNVDSIVVFEGIVGVETRNELSDIRLVAGGESAFSKVIKNELDKKTNLWHPAHVDNRSIKSRVRIYARLNSNGSVTFKTTPKQLTYDLF